MMSRGSLSLEGRELMATAPELTRNHMEVRGIGIINVASVFGIGSIRIEKRLDLVVTLKDWQEVEEVDRIGLDREFYEILGLQVPHVTIPVQARPRYGASDRSRGDGSKIEGTGSKQRCRVSTPSCSDLMEQKE